MAFHLLEFDEYLLNILDILTLLPGKAKRRDAALSENPSMAPFKSFH